MRKHVKILVSVIAVLCMVVGAAIPAFAAEKITASVAIPNRDYEGWESEPEGEAVRSADLGNGASFSYNHVPGKDNLQEKDGIWQVSVGQAPTFKFTVAEAGEYTLTLGYSSKTSEGQERAATIKVNDGEAVKITNVDQTSDNWNVRRELTLTVTLVAGENTIVFGQNTVVAEGKTAKDINIIDLAVESNFEVDNTQGDDDNQNAGDDNNNDNTQDNPEDSTAGKTGFATIALAIAAIGSGAVVVSKRRH